MSSNIDRACWWWLNGRHALVRLRVACAAGLEPGVLDLTQVDHVGDDEYGQAPPIDT